MKKLYIFLALIITFIMGVLMTEKYNKINKPATLDLQGSNYILIPKG